MERFVPNIFIIKHRSDDRSFGARFEKCLDLDNHFGFYSMAIFQSLRNVGRRIYFNQYYFSSLLSNNYFCSETGVVNVKTTISLSDPTRSGGPQVPTPLEVYTAILSKYLRP